MVKEWLASGQFAKRYGDPDLFAQFFEFVAYQFMLADFPLQPRRDTHVV